MQPGEERASSLTVNVPAMNPKGTPQAASYRKDRDSGDDRQSVVTIPTVLDRWFSCGRPRATHNGLEPRAALVDQHERPAFLCLSLR